MIVHTSFILTVDETESKQAEWRRCCIQSGNRSFLPPYCCLYQSFNLSGLRHAVCKWLICSSQTLGAEQVAAWSRWHTVRRRNATWQMSDKEVFSGGGQTLKTDMRCVWKLSKRRVGAAKWKSWRINVCWKPAHWTVAKFTNFFRLETRCWVF